MNEKIKNFWQYFPFLNNIILVFLLKHQGEVKSKREDKKDWMVFVN